MGNKSNYSIQKQSPVRYALRDSSAPNQLSEESEKFIDDVINGFRQRQIQEETKQKFGQTQIIALEVQSLFLFKGSPNIIQLDQVFSKMDYQLMIIEYFMIMEYMLFGSLDNVIIQNKTKFYSNLSTQQQELVFVYISNEVLKGLVEIHKQNLVHRDIKSGNVLVNEKGEIKICDFGLIGEVNKSGNLSGCCGTRGFVAPQVLKGTVYNNQADIWSIGVLALELAEGSSPFQDMVPSVFEYVVNHQEITFLNPSNWSQDFASFIRLCFKVDASQRPSAQDLLKESLFNKVDQGKQLFIQLIKNLQDAIESKKQ